MNGTSCCPPARTWRRWRSAVLLSRRPYRADVDNTDTLPQQYGGVCLHCHADDAAACLPFTSSPSSARLADEEPAVVAERYALYRSIISALHARAVSQAEPQSSPPLPLFSLHERVAIVASPGRDRIMMGHVSRAAEKRQRRPLSSAPTAPSPPPASHLRCLRLPAASGVALLCQTDFAGLGGFTVDCATREELLCVAQLTTDGCLQLHNSDTAAFPSQSVPLASLRAVAADSSAYGRSCFPSNLWSSYPCGALTFMLSSRFPHHAEVQQRLSGVRLYVSSAGALALPHTGGVSSSAALTGAVSLCLSQLLFPSSPLSLSCLASVDYGEYYLGKFAGCADKMSQLFAQAGRLTVIGSRPERLLSSLRFPSRCLSLLIAESDMPRLTLPPAQDWLRRQGMDEQQAAAVLAHARSVMIRFGSVVYCRAAEIICSTVEAQAVRIGLTVEEATAVRQALLGRCRADQSEQEEEGRGGPLLRELCSGGLLEDWLPELAGWERRQLRYSLVYRLLLLLPLTLEHEHSGQQYQLHPRKAALYGISEVERGAAYLRDIGCINAIIIGSAASAETQQQLDDAVRRVLRCVELCHDGDRGVVDFRLPASASQPASSRPQQLSRHDLPFQPTAWASQPSVALSDADVLRFLQSGTDLLSAVGSFERSAANVDDACDEMRREWEGRAAARISAAGLGGRLGIHCRTELLEEVKAWLEQRGWRCRQPRPGAPTQHISW